MNPLAQALSTALLHFVWQGILVAFLLWMALFLLRKRSPNVRYAASCAALAMLALLPAITAYVAYTEPATPAALANSARGAAPSHSVGVRIDATAPAWLEAAESWALPVWALGVLLFSMRAVWGWRQVSRMRRRGTRADAPLRDNVARLAARLGISRAVRVLITTATESPSVVGWIRPVILLPAASLMGLTPEQLEAVLAHELAHIRRFDHLVNGLQIAIETLLFYHPAVWWTSSRIRHERELCCDDLAVRSCGDVLCYARALTKLERLRAMTPAAALGSTGGAMLYRIQRLLGSTNQQAGPSKLPGLVTLALGVACLLINVHWAQGQQPQPAPAAEGQNVWHFVTTQPHDARGVSVDLGGAPLAHRTGVEYPEAARKSGVQGSVAVEVTLDAQGAVSDARVLSGPAELRRAVLTSVLQWHFRPEAPGTVRTLNINFQTPPAEAEPTIGYAGRKRTAREGAGQMMLTVTPSQDSPEVQNLKQQIENLERNVQSAQEHNDPANALQARVQNLRTRLAELLDSPDRSNQTFVRVSPESNTQSEGRMFLFERPPLAGRRVAQINLEGISDQGTILAPLPVHVGDALTENSREEISRAVRKIDEHLRANFELLESGDVAIIIYPTPERVRQ